MTLPSPRPKSPALTGAALMVLAGALFAVVNALLQYGAMMLHLPPTRLAFWQYAIALLCALPWLVRNVKVALGTRALPAHLLRVAFAVAGVQFWTIGLQQVPVWQAIALILLSPFFVTLGAGLLLKEQLTLERWIAVLGGILGGVIILAPWSDAFRPAALLPVIAAACWAATTLMTKRMTKTQSPEALTFFLLLLLTPVNAVIAAGSGLAIGSGEVTLLLLAIGILTALAQYLLARAYSIADAAYLQPFDQLKLPLNVGLNLAFFGFVPPGSMWLGSLLILVASFYLLRQEMPRDQAPAQPAQPSSM
ncbi:DMT family transporter [Pseudooceanicola sp. CBS1P-1]|uniref:EamA family transporter n=1 Tax=Pseudooceanicola albus TaxID=2692189 RepID=A0A6L7GA28_9RHOB|nr:MULTISPECIES: DMT family transporter [Pseudooceanicola]MBT9385966.1 DMT family transporter [Pseudooceanicola endophyticus]MXN19613.1 EamA family transporter [Pseudooceanicola albus]